MVKVPGLSSCSAIDAEYGIGGIAGILTRESNGLPSCSGSGRVPNLEVLDTVDPAPEPDLILPLVVDRLPIGDIMKPAGE